MVARSALHIEQVFDRARRAGGASRVRLVVRTGTKFPFLATTGEPDTAATMRAPRPTLRTVPRLPRRGRAPSRGQSLVEFSLILGPLMFLLLGIVQFGFIFGTYVTLTSATREAARTGTIYVYDLNATQGVNDLARNEEMRQQLLASMNGLGKTSPQFASSSTWTSSTSGSATTFTTGDLTITYELPTGVTNSMPRAGYRVTVKATYHQDLIIPLIANVLPRDGGGRLAMSSTVTMVIN
jgi:Flp pilus assembly protein TadG